MDGRRSNRGRNRATWLDAEGTAAVRHLLLRPPGDEPDAGREPETEGLEMGRYSRPPRTSRTLARSPRPVDAPVHSQDLSFKESDHAQLKSWRTAGG